MTDRVRRQVKWLIGELLQEASEGTVITLMVCGRNTVKVYMNSKEMAVLSEHVSGFNWCMERPEVARHFECCKAAARRERDEERR